MKQILALVKKDFLLIKNFLPLTLLFSLAIPLLISREAGSLGALGPYLYTGMVVFLSFMVYHMISMEEMKEEGMVYLQTTPLSNSLIGLAKFAVVLISFTIISLVYLLPARLGLIDLGLVGLRDVLIALLFLEIFFAIYIPLTFKLGYTRLQFVSMILIMGGPFLVSFLSKKSDFLVRMVASLKKIPSALVLPLSLVLGIFILITSLRATSLILEKKEF